MSLAGLGVIYMKKFNNVYKNKVVLVTGHTGFKGSWLSIWLNSLGAKVVGYSLDPASESDNFMVTNIKDKIVDIRGDIREESKLQQVFEKYNPEFVFHLAAQPLVRLSYEIPKETYEVNVMGTLNILECIRKSTSVKAAVIITTDKCYENKEQLTGYKETDPMGGFDPYSSSKGCAELLISSYVNSFFNLNNYNNHKKAISSARAGNVIGGGDWAKDRLVPDCMRALMNNKTIEIRNPHSVRPWQHVLEPLGGYLLLGSKLYENGVKYSGGWNFGPESSSLISVNKIVNLIIENWESGQYVDIPSENSLHEAKLLSLDITKAKTKLNWFPVLNIEECINLTTEWYKQFSHGADMYSICMDQIHYYENKFFK